MKRRQFLAGSAALVGGIAIARDIPQISKVYSNQPQFATGTVYHDFNGNGKRDGGEAGIEGVLVSNGVQVTKTDALGRWILPVSSDNVFFVIKPSGFKVPLARNNIPQYFYIHKPEGSPEFKYPGITPTGLLPESIDFGLQKQDESSSFKVFLFGDPQPRNQTEIDYMSHDMIEQVAQDAIKHKVKFGISLGDEMFDNLSLYETLNGSIGTVGVPWYNTVGNHDLNYDSDDNDKSTETFERVFGPTNYAFNYANAHFLVLNDVYWKGKATPGYTGTFTPEALAFAANDLKHVPKDKLVVVCMHIPLNDIANKADLLALLSDFPNTLSVSAHTHVQKHVWLGEADGFKGRNPHHHLNHVTVCGSWWQGAPDERGIPHATMSDGGPNGYSILSIDGAKYSVTFRAASRPEDYQMNIWAPDVVVQGSSEGREIVVNVFAGSSKSVTRMRVDNGPWLTMERFVGKDPGFLKLKALEASPTPPPGLKLPGASDTDHLWKGVLPASLAMGNHRVEILTRDMWGQEYRDSWIYRIVEAV